MPRFKPQLMINAEKTETSTAIAKATYSLENKGCKPKYTAGIERDLWRLAKNVDIFDTEKVNNYIATQKILDIKTKQRTDKNWSDGYRTRMANAYEIFCAVNNMEYSKPKFAYKSPIPLIPKTEYIDAIVANAPKRIGVVFKILSETAIEGFELEMIPMKQINAQDGILSVVGVKRHDNGTYKLKPQTAQMLRDYLATHQREYPFPKVASTRESWRLARRSTAKKLCNPEILKMQMKNLRNYAGAIFYLTMGKDPIATMHFMRHKDIQTTMDYLRGLTEFSANAEYISKIATTAEEAIELINQGFKEQAIFGEKHVFSKLKY
jgi:integrase